MRIATSKTDFPNVPRGFWAPRGGLGGALMAPRLSVEPPLEIVSARVRLAVFSVPGGTPPKTPFHPKYTYLQWFLMIFRRTRARKWEPPGSPLIWRRPPRGGKSAPEKVRAGPPGPNGAPGTSSRAPGTLRAAPRGAQGGHGGIPGSPGGDTGRSLSFCYTSPLILMVFSKCCCGPCFELVFFP